MARKSTIENDVLLDRLSRTFRDVGYDAASLSLLSQATGLKKASLYHRFPGGKEQMGEEVLQQAGRWLTEHILTPLSAKGAPADKIASMVNNLDQFYAGGSQACLLNLLSSPVNASGLFNQTIRTMFEAFITALAQVAIEAGASAKQAPELAERAMIVIQGSLVLSRGLGSTEPFRKALTQLPDILVSNQGHNR